MERPEKITAVLFDCDGVLIDSEPVSAALNAKVYQALGVPATAEDCMTLCGKDVSHAPEIAELYGMHISVEGFIEAYKQERAAGTIPPSTYDVPELQLMPGIKKLLARLRRQGIACGLVSSSVAPDLLALLNRFGLTSAFDVIIAGDMVAQHKPKPAPYLKAMSYLGVAPEHTVVVEDSPIGIAAGVAARAYVLGFTGSEVQQDTSAAHETLSSYADFDLV